MARLPPRARITELRGSPPRRGEARAFRRLPYLRLFVPDLTLVWSCVSLSQWVQRRGPGLGFDTVENAEGVFRSCSLGNKCSSLASRRDPPHLKVNEKKKHRRRSVPGLCSNACPGHGRHRRRPCSSVRDAQLRCASGKRKHGHARARAPQRSTLKDPIIF